MGLTEGCQPQPASAGLLSVGLGFIPGRNLAWERTVSLTIDLPDLDATLALGQRLGTLLFPGAVVALVGQLGAGKTHLARGIAEGLGIPDSRAVTSPTFVLMQEYPARLTIYHFD